MVRNGDDNWKRIGSAARIRNRLLAELADRLRGHDSKHQPRKN